MFCLLFFAFGPRLGCNSCRPGLSLGPLGRCSVLGMVVVRLRLGTLLLSILKNLFLVLLIRTCTCLLLVWLSPLILLMDYVLCRFGLPGWFRHAYFQYHAHVRPRFELSCGLGQSLTRDGGLPQGCPLSMVFIVALSTFPGVDILSRKPQLYAYNLKGFSSDDDLLDAARFTNHSIRLVGQTPVPSKCVLLSTYEGLGSL